MQAAARGRRESVSASLAGAADTPPAHGFRRLASCRTWSTCPAAWTGSQDPWDRRTRSAAGRLKVRGPAARTPAARSGLEGPYRGRGVSAIDGDDLAGDVVGAAPAQEYCQRRDVGRRAQPRVRLIAAEPLFHLRLLPHPAVQIGEDEAGSDAVHLDVVLAPLGRQRLGQLS